MEKIKAEELIKLLTGWQIEDEKDIKALLDIIPEIQKLWIPENKNLFEEFEDDEE